MLAIQFRESGFFKSKCADYGYSPDNTFTFSVEEAECLPEIFYLTLAHLDGW